MVYKPIHRLSLVLILCSIAFYSCKKEEEKETQEDLSVYGKKLNNPYSVTNMQKAYDSLLASSPSARIAGQGIEITATHHYVRFFPKTEGEVTLLTEDSLELFNQPIDYEEDTLG